MKKIKTKKLTWIDIKDPTVADIEQLKHEFDIHHLILDQVIPPSHRSKVEQFEDFLYLVIYFPVYNKESRQTETRELDIIIGKKLIITSHYKSIIPLKELFDQCNLYEEMQEQYMQNPSMLIYYLIENMHQHSLPKLDNIARKIDRVEKEVFEGREKEMLNEIAIIKRDILNMSKAIKPEQGVILSLKKIYNNIYFQDLASSYSYIRNILENHQHMIESLEETNNTLLSHKLNEIVKILTIISFITFPLSVIAGIFGMNVFMGFSMHRLTFWIILAFMAIMSIIMTIYFKKKRWL